MKAVKKALEWLAMTFVSIGFLVGFLGLGNLKGLGYGAMMGADWVTHALPFGANELMWLSISWPLWFIVGAVIMLLSKKL